MELKTGYECFFEYYFIQISKIEDYDEFMRHLNLIDPIIDRWVREDFIKAYIAISTAIKSGEVLDVWRTNQEPPAHWIEYDPNEIDSFLARLELMRLVNA